MSRNDYLAIIFCLMAFTLFTISVLQIKEETGIFFNTNDYQFHLNLSNNSCFLEHYPKEACNNYAKIFSTIAGFFSKTEFEFILFILIILYILTPLLLYSKTRSFWTLIIYYASFWHFNILFASIFAQMTLGVFFILILFNKSFKINLIFYLIGLFSHSKAFFVLTPILIYTLIENKKIDFNLPIFPITVLKETTFNLDSFLNLMPTPLYYYFFQLDLKKKLLIAYFFIGSLIIDYRVSLFIPLLYSIWLPNIFQTKNNKIKALLLLNFVLYFFAMYLITFHSLLETNLEKDL